MTTNEKREAARAKIKIGDRFKVRDGCGWFDRSRRGRLVEPGEVLEVVGIDPEGDPLFGDASGEGSLYADDLLGRADRIETAPAFADDAPDSVTLGACYRDPSDGEIVRVIEIDPRLRALRGVGPFGTSDADTWGSAWVFRSVFSERVPDPTPALAEAPASSTEDRKPRGVKPALALIPWEVVPDRLVPEVVRESTDPARVIEILLDTQGDAFLDDVARAFEHGAAKYGRDNWRTIEWGDTARREYESAMLRHLYADAIGEKNDPDSGVSHLAHACASAMIHTFHTRKARA